MKLSAIDDLVCQARLAELVVSTRGAGAILIYGFRTYLFATARHLLYKEYRRKRRHDDHIDFTECSAVDLAPSPSRILVKKAEERLLLEGLRSIPIDYQIALELYMWEDLSGKELAEVLGLSEDRARSRVHRAKQSLKKQLERLSESPERLESTVSDLDGWAASLRAGMGAGEAGG